MDDRLATKFGEASSCGTPDAGPPTSSSAVGAQAVVVIVATKDRPKLLCERRLPSIFAQTRAPDAVLIVQDYTVSIM